MTAPITPATIARLRELLAAATAGPWAGMCSFVIEAAKGPHHTVCSFVNCDGDGGVNQRLVIAMRNAIPALLDQLDAQAAEIKALRSAMLSALSATRAKVEDDISTEWLCLGADEIRLCIRRMDQERAEQTARADKAEARVVELERELAEARKPTAAAVTAYDAGHRDADERVKELEGRLRHIVGDAPAAMEAVAGCALVRRADLEAGRAAMAKREGGR